MIGTPAMIEYHGAMHIVARGNDNSIIWHWWGTNGDTWNREKLPGAFIGIPDLAVYGNQFQVSGRGIDGMLYTVWYENGRWSTSYHGIPVGD
ncbi:hypothetical protein AB0F81_06605 [Actinoplanes sp. NPDC024001]|uniref:hypothetical protein n=1 Tax=Actinoplanes sp. NPDC024001 TaxID=3154598 RepID=UPI0033D462FF